MSDTPHLDAAFRAGCPWYTCEAPACQPECAPYKTSALEILRAALPWDLPAERLEAMAEEYFNGDAVYQDDLADMQNRYRADPIMRELWPEKF